jgi:hypothetical protein
MECECDMCRNGMASVIEAAKDNMKRVGRTCLGVMGDPPFMYTVGNTQRGLPELLLIGSCEEAAKDMLNFISEKIAEDQSERSMDLGGKAPVYLLEADDSAKDYTRLASHFFDRYNVMQVIPSDMSGKFPWDKGCKKPYRNAPVLRKVVS